MGRMSRRPEEERLECFVGDWVASGHVAPGPFGSGGETTGKTTYRWRVGGKWLVYTSQMVIPGLGDYEVHGGVTFNSKTGKYDAFAANSLGNLIVYEGVWTDQTTLIFTLIHPPPAGKSRVLYRVLGDGSLRMSSERAAEEGGFQAYFETEMKRLREPEPSGEQRP